MATHTKKKKSTVPDKVRPYVFHGCDLKSATNSQYVGECPFCLSEDKEGKFYVDTKTGQYHCKHCGDKGNAYTFCSKLYDNAFKTTTKEDYKVLEEIRFGSNKGNDWTMFKNAGIAWDGNMERWLLPVFNLKGSLTNLHAWREGGSWYSTPDFRLNLFGSEQLANPPKGPIYVVEGGGDYATFRYLHSKCRKKGVVVGVPGCEVFNASWMEYFSMKDITLIYDHDNAGLEGMRRAAYQLSGRTNSCSVIQWPSTLEEGTDLSDVWKDLRPAHKKPGTQ